MSLRFLNLIPRVFELINLIKKARLDYVVDENETTIIITVGNKDLKAIQDLIKVLSNEVKD